MVSAASATASFRPTSTGCTQDAIAHSLQQQQTPRLPSAVHLSKGLPLCLMFLPFMAESGHRFLSVKTEVLPACSATQSSSPADFPGCSWNSSLAQADADIRGALARLVGSPLDWRLASLESPQAELELVRLPSTLLQLTSPV